MKNKKTIGSKTKKLQELIDLGLNVPEFVAISSEELKNNDYSIDLKCDLYVVRSSAIIEDNETESYAGQFETEIAVSKENLDESIKRVVAQAKGLLSDDLDKFSIIIQEYIEPEFSGVTFTRNPSGGREMIIEYHKGRGEDLVGGKIKPKKLEIYSKSIISTDLPRFQEAIKIFQKIEKHFDFPQDIEWCVKDDKWYFLQTRPITTLSKEQFTQSQYLDKNLPKKEFYFEKTEISEIAPRPTTFTIDLLRKIYEDSGPIEIVYKKHCLKYKHYPLLKVIGNELFTDKRNEIKTLLPSYDYSTDLKPKFSTFSGIFKTLKNIYCLNFIKLGKYKDLFEKLKNKLITPNSTDTINKAIKKFLKDYELIFEINFLTGIAIKKLDKLNIQTSKMLSYGNELFPELNEYKIQIDDDNLKGNTLEVSDVSDFSAVSSQSIEENEKFTTWWNSFSSVKKEMVKETILNALIYNKLREFSRWLVVKNINCIRNILLITAKNKGFSDPESIYFAKIAELLSKDISEKECEKRKAKFHSFDKFSFPSILSLKPHPKNFSSTTGISSGAAEGVLLKEKDINDDKYKNKDIILYTEVLSPQLTKHFDKIKGIVSENGGFLSHLAIIAREKHLPTIVNFNLQNSKIKLGDRVKVNGDNGKIESR